MTQLVYKGILYVDSQSTVKNFIAIFILIGQEMLVLSNHIRLEGDRCFARNRNKVNLPLAAVGTDGSSSLMFKTSGHFDSIDCTKKCNNVDLLSDVFVLVS